MKSKMKRRMLAIVLCMVIVLSNSSFIFASSESGTPAVEAASTEGTTSQTETDTQVTETTPQTLAVSESTPASTEETAAPTSAEATPTPTDTPDVTTTPEPTGTPTPEATPTPTDTPETTTTPEPTDTPEMTTTPEPTDTPEATPTPTQGPEDGTSDTVQPTETPTPTEAPVKSNEAVELKQEFKDSDGNVTSTVKAQIPEGTFAADASEITMEVQTPDTASAEHVKEMMEELLPENHMLGDYIFYDIQFKVNGTVTEPQKPITITFEGEELSVKDVKRANVFWLDPEDPQVDGDKDQLVEITQKSEMIENLQNSGQSTENIDDYDLSEITLKEDGVSDKIQMEGRTSTIYGCYVVYEPVQVLTYDDDQVTVTVSAAEEGIIPANAELKVVPITAEDKNTEDQYKEVEQKLQEKAEEDAYDIAGFLAYDITFVDEDGNETEPGGEVKVSIDYKEAAIPEAISEEDATNAEVTVLHLEEDEKGEVKEVVDMAQEEKVDVLATTEENKVEKAEVRTESFSVFTIIWNYSRYSRFTISAHYVYESADGSILEIPDNEIPDYVDPWEKTLSSEEERIDLTAEEYEISIPGYTHLRTVADDSNSESEITYLVKDSESGWPGGTTYYIGHDNNGEWLSTSWGSSTAGDIYFVYQKMSGLQIVDNIIEGGDLQAVYTPTDNKTVREYQWYRGTDENQNGTIEDDEYEPVEKINYVGGGTNVSDDGVSLFPAYDDGARKWYKVVATLSDGSTIESSPYQVPYYDSLQNGSFENPEYRKYNEYTRGQTPVTMSQVSNASYKEEGIWQTTGTQNGKDIEILGAGEIIDRQGTDGLSEYYAWKRGQEPSAAHGVQFAELNCETAGALYQDVLTIPGTPLNYSLSHRARGKNNNYTEYDTMFLVIMPTKDSQNLTTQTQLENKLISLGVDIGRFSDEDEENEIVYDDNGILVVRITSDDQDWHGINAETYIPETSATRFFFMAGSTAASRDGDRNGNTVGNFLDNVWFSQELPDVAEDEFSLEIRKEFEGLDSTGIANVKNKIQFTITAKDSEGKDLSETEVQGLFGTNVISGGQMIQAADGSLSYTITNRKIDPSAQYTVTITESNAELENYQLTSEAMTRATVGEEEGEPAEGSTFELQGDTIAYVTFTNTYERSENKTVSFTKVWDDDDNHYHTRPDSLDVTLVATITVSVDGELQTIPLNEEQLGGVTLTKAINAESGWKTSWDVPVYYDYNGAKVKIDYTVTEGEINSDYVYESTGTLPGSGEDYTDQFNGDDVTVATPVSDQNSDQATADAVQASATSKTVSTAAEDALGEPAHNKYIEYNESTGDYTLNLDVTGAQGEASGVDILFVIDTSGSMGGGYSSLLRNVKTLLTKDNGIIDQIFASEGNVNSVAYVSFAGMRQTDTSSWYQTSGKEELKDEINGLRATGGTNWTYAMQQASNSLARRAASENEKVVIFLSDGEPTYSMSNGREYGYGNRTIEAYYNEAIAAVANSQTLREATMYSVYLTSDTEEGMKKFADGTGATLKNGTDLDEALEDILKTVIPTYENVTITDTLSQYVDFVAEDVAANVTVTMKTANGTETPLNNDQYHITVNGKTIQINLLNNASLANGVTYTVSFRVKPNKTANDYFAEHGYPKGMEGEAGTGTTSAGQAGFYSNDEGSAKVTYTVNGEPGSADYPMPVVQVTTHTLTFNKIWNHPAGMTPPSENVTLYVTYTDGTVGEITLNASNNYTVTLSDVPVTKKIATVTETSTFENYTPSYRISSDGTSATVINNYSKLTTQNIKVEKRWEGDGPQTPIEVVLYQSINNGDAIEYGRVTLSGNDWTHEWKDLPLTKEVGDEVVEEYTYAVREVSTPAGYSSSISYSFDEENETTTATITNTYDPNCADEEFYIANILQKEKLTVSKTWDDNRNILGFRPDELPITILDGKGGSYSVELTGDKEDEVWQETLTILKKKAPIFSATETLLGNDYYRQVGTALIESTDTGTRISFTNELISKSIIVKKEWNDGEIADRPTGITFTLQYSNDSGVTWEEYDTYRLLEEDMIYANDGSVTYWAIEISGLPVGYEYQVVEGETAGGYNSSVKVNGNTYTITNTLKWSLTKTNMPDNGETAVPLAGAEFTLKQGETAIATGVSENDGKVTWTPSNGYDLNSLDGDYTLTETKAPSGYQILQTSWNLTFSNGLLTSATGDGNYDIYISKQSDAENGVVVTVKNALLYELPETGGNGIYWYTIGGVLLMMAGTLILYRNKRKGVRES